MSEQTQSKKNKMLENPFVKGLIVGVILFGVLGGVYFAGRSASDEKTANSGLNGAAQPTQPSAPSQPQPTQPSRGKVAAVTAEDHIRGNPDAKIKIIEYSDLECPFCQRFHSTAQQAVDEGGGQVAWVYRHFPLSSHANAQEKAEATECAAELGGNDAFWTYIDEIFKVGPSFSTAQLTTLAKNIGISESDFETCLTSGRHTQTVRAQFTSGQQAGVTGTPGSFIVSSDGQQEYISGALPYGSIKQVIDTLL